MNLIELYEQTPPEKHKDIIVRGDQVYINDVDGARLTYLIVSEDLISVASDRDIKDIKKKVGA